MARWIKSGGVLVSLDAPIEVADEAARFALVPSDGMRIRQLSDGGLYEYLGPSTELPQRVVVSSPAITAQFGLTLLYMDGRGLWTAPSGSEISYNTSLAKLEIKKGVLTRYRAVGTGVKSPDLVPAWEAVNGATGTPTITPWRTEEWSGGNAHSFSVAPVSKIPLVQNSVAWGYDLAHLGLTHFTPEWFCGWMWMRQMYSGTMMPSFYGNDLDTESINFILDEAWYSGVAETIDLRGSNVSAALPDAQFTIHAAAIAVLSGDRTIMMSTGEGAGYFAITIYVAIGVPLSGSSYLGGGEMEIGISDAPTAAQIAAKLAEIWPAELGAALQNGANAEITIGGAALLGGSAICPVSVYPGDESFFTITAPGGSSAFAGLVIQNGCTILW